MMEQAQQRVVPSASAEVQEALPKAVVTKEDLLDDTTSSCPICLDKFMVGARALRMLCGHLFCMSCISSWLGTANSCPVCRYELPTDSLEFEAARLERMSGRKACLKEGELRGMSMPRLRQLMQILRVSDA